MPKVSICTSVLNQSELLRGMIESVRAQTFEDWELIIVDDGSPEDIPSVVASFNDPRIKVESFPENRGVPHGINRALSLATGDYIGVLSTDERIWNEKLAVQVEYLDSHPDIGAVWGLPQQGPLGERPSYEQYGLKAHDRSREAWVRTLVNLENIPIGGAAMLMRKACIDDIGLFDPEHFTTSDLEWFCRFFEKYEGRILPYRFAIEVKKDETPLRMTVTPEAFQADMKRVREKHPAKPKKVLKDVTIAIPVRNMASTIAATINSVKAQTWEHWKIMVLDDASTDNTADIVKSFADPRIQLFQFDENRGCNEAQNQMLARCETPFFVVLAADDTLDPMFLEACIGAFAADPWLEFVASQTDFIDESGNPHQGEHPLKNIAKAQQMSREQWLANLYNGNLYFGAGMYRTEVAKELGGWDGSVGVIADYDMYLKLLQRENIKIIHEPLTHTRIHEGQRSLLKGPEAVVELKKHYHTVKSRYYPPRKKVIIATPFYEMRGFSPYIRSLLSSTKLLTQMGIDWDYWEIAGDSYVERAKNTIMNKFVEDPANTDLFIIDSDMEWNPTALLELLRLDEEIVTGSYPQKNAWGKFTGIPELVTEDGKTHPIGRVLSNGSALIKAGYLAGGFMRIRREALERFVEAYPQHRYRDTSADPGYPERIYTEFCCCENAKMNEEDDIALRWGEDRVMGKRFKAIGIDSWIYPAIEFGHYGIKGWKGNFDTWLRNPAKQGITSEHSLMQSMT